MSADYSITQLCAALAVTRSGYHAWLVRTPGPRAQADAALVPLIAEAHREGPARNTAVPACVTGCRPAAIAADADASIV